MDGGSGHHSIDSLRQHETVMDKCTARIASVQCTSEPKKGGGH